MSIKMLSNSVQIALFIILWVTKLIHNKQPMYAVLDKDTIKNEILPHLSVAKRTKYFLIFLWQNAVFNQKVV